MRHTLETIVLLLAVFLSAAGVHCAAARTKGSAEHGIIVALDGSGRYRSINKAISKAEDGDVILVRAGVYSEEVEVPSGTKDLTLIGDGPGRTIIDADGAYAALALKSDGNKVSGFTLRGGTSHGLYVPDGHQEIENCLIYGNKDRGIYISSLYGTGTAEIRHCTIVDNDVSGIYTVEDDPETSIIDCIVAFNNRGIVADENKDNATVENNCLYNESENLDRIGPGADNIELDPGFRDREKHDYRLNSDSPCVGAASDGKNIGCF